MKSCKELEKELYLVIITDMLLHQVHFPGIPLEKNTLCCLRVQGLVISWQFQLDNYWPGTCTLLFGLKGDTTYTPSAHLFDLLSPLERLFGSWHHTKFPTDRQKNPASCTLILANSTSWGAVKSWVLSRYFAFSWIPHCILVKSWIRKYPSRPW